jgi:hypothetical protein
MPHAKFYIAFGTVKSHTASNPANILDGPISSPSIFWPETLVMISK